jgi:hypothetical protein
MMRIRTGVPCLWLLVALLTQAELPLRAGEKTTSNAALESITTDDLQHHVDILADDALEGREAGSRGGHRAAVYLANALTVAGLAGNAPSGGYFQPFSAAYRNVLAQLPGSDPALAGEWLVVSAHYDHVGYGTRRNSYGSIGMIHNGADDNASGTSVVLELAEAFAQLTQSPRRSILFAFWDGEEKGLLGSKYWAAHPSVPLPHVRAAVCLDMVGRLRKARLQIFGARTGWGLRRRLSEANQGTGLWLEFPWKLQANADHWPLIQRRIPTLLFHTGLHDQYHRPSDDADLINSQGMRAITRLLFRYVDELANADELPGYRAQGRDETPAIRRWNERLLSPLPGRLGLAWSRRQPPQGGVTVTRVLPESAAAAAGIQPGDRIVTVDDQPLERGDQLRTAVLAAAAELQLSVARSKPGQPEPEQFDVTVKLPGHPTRVGISWREDTAQPGSVMVTRLVPGSAAALAGLRAGDRVYQFDGHDFADTEQFAQRLRQASGPITLEIERHGQLETLPLDLSPAN